MYVRSDTEKGEPLLLDTNVIISPGFMQPAAGVEAPASKEKSGGVVTVRLVKAERIARES